MSWLIEVAKNPRFIKVEKELLGTKESHSLDERVALEAVRMGYMTRKDAWIIFLHFIPAFVYQILLFGTVFVAIYVYRLWVDGISLNSMTFLEHLLYVSQSVFWGNKLSLGRITFGLIYLYIWAQLVDRMAVFGVLIVVLRKGVCKRGRASDELK